MASSPGGGEHARDWRIRNGIQKASKSGRQSGATQYKKHPEKPNSLAAVAKKDNGKMNSDNRLQAFDAYTLRVETKPLGK
jgi:hypothetical protein